MERSNINRAFRRMRKLQTSQLLLVAMGGELSPHEEAIKMHRERTAKGSSSTKPSLRLALRSKVVVETAHACACFWVALVFSQALHVLLSR